MEDNTAPIVAQEPYNTIKFIKIREVKTPAYGTDGSAGIDFFVPEDFKPHHLTPGHGILIPSGIKTNVPDNMVLIGFNKSGVASKKKLQIGACVIDSDYQGEIHLHVFNTSNDDIIEINPGDKLVQYVLLPYVHAILKECLTIEEVFPHTTVRGEGGFGHTGAK
jgi:dUTP pyrophosphatase